MERKRTTIAIVAGLLTGILITPAFAYTFQSGDIFASVNNGLVKVYRGGLLLDTLNTGQGGYTTGSTTDTGGNFYVTNFSTGSISKFDPTGVGLGVIATGYNTPESIVFAQNGTAYVSQVGGSSIGTFTNTTAVPVGARTDWIDLAADQTTILYTNEGGSIFRTTTGGVALTPFATALPGTAYALRILGDGSVLLADSFAALHLDSSGAIINTYTVAGVVSLFALNIDPDGTSFWTGDDGTGLLYQFDIATGALLSTLDTGVGGGNLYGVSVYGEFQAGGGGVGGGSETPLPAALPLFATGLAAFGVFGRRRRRKAAALAA